MEVGIHVWREPWLECWYAILAIAGMLTGAAIYYELFPFFKSSVLAWKDYGKVGLAEILNVS